MELAEQLVKLTEVLADIAMDVANRTELFVKFTGRTELKAQVEI